MKRSIVINKSSDSNRANENNRRQSKRTLEDSTVKTKLKRPRHLSPEHNNRKTSSLSRRKSKQRSSFNRTIPRTKNDSQTFRKSSSRHYSLSTKYLTEITLPNWERVSPNIDQILSDKHTQSGVYAHEIHLIQQELESLLSMSIIRENVLNPTKLINTDHIQLKIHQHQQAECVYSSKNIPNKPLMNCQQEQQQRNNDSNLLLDRQVSMTPVTNAHIDKIWSAIDTYYREISSNDILAIEKLIAFNQKLEDKVFNYKNEYRNNILTQLNIIEQLNEENFQELLHITKINPLITHYTDRTTIGRFQKKLYDYLSYISPVYKTPFSSSFYQKLLTNHFDNNLSLRSSPRLQSNHRLNLFSSPNCKSDDDLEQPSLRNCTRQTRTTTTNPYSSVLFQEHVQLVRDYLTDQHLCQNENTKHQLNGNNNMKLNKRRKTSLIKYNNHCKDTFDTKLSTLMSLLHECSSLSLSALERARLLSNNEQIWQKLNAIEQDLESLIQQIDTNDDDNNSISTEKTFQTLGRLLNDWKKYEDDYSRQMKQLCNS